MQLPSVELSIDEIHLVLGLIDEKVVRESPFEKNRISYLRKRLIEFCVAKADDFEANLESDYYRQSNQHSSEFHGDALGYLIKNGVPKAKASKVLERAWEDGHSSGFNEVKSHMDNLIEIFAETGKK